MDKKFKDLDSYYQAYKDDVPKEEARQVVDSFDEEWQECAEIDENRVSKYGKVLVIYSVGVNLLPDLQYSQVEKLANLIEYYDNNPKVERQLVIKSLLFWNIGLCWHTLDSLYDVKAIEALKRHTFYMIAQSSYIKYNPIAYQFHRCDKYLFKSLINEELNVSSPSTFNDPLDCPLKNLLAEGDDYSRLMLEANKDCLKIACFINNVKQPYLTDDNKLKMDEKKHNNDDDEFLNTLLWAHYADNHKGVCIKYQFPESMSKLFADGEGRISFFRDVKYSDESLEKYSNAESISLLDAYFLKGKAWEYENELRFLYFDYNGKGDHQQVAIPGCIEAVYFGLNCPESDKSTIRKILDSKLFKCPYEKPDGKGLENITKGDHIKFYQIEYDHNHFGQLIAKEIQ